MDAFIFRLLSGRERLIEHKKATKEKMATNTTTEPDENEIKLNAIGVMLR